MKRILTFSRYFPSYHPLAGQPTYFVEKFWNSILYINTNPYYIAPVQPPINEYIYDVGGKLGYEYAGDALSSVYKVDPKNHTIRKGKRWKAGDYIIPRVWGDDINPKSGRKGPYHSKQIEIGPPIEVVKVWDFEVVNDGMGCGIFIAGKEIYFGGCERLARNDGLTLDQIEQWFKWPKPFSGQIICWNPDIKY